LLIVPLGEGAVFCYADIASANGRPIWDWRGYFNDLDKPITELLAQAGHLAGSPIMEVEQPYSFLGRTVLIGDAAHAMSPSMSQGVALAVEDALVLAETLSSLPVYQALPAYEERRAERIAWVRSQAHRRDSARGLTRVVRDRVLKLSRRCTGLAGQQALVPGTP
jgi:2-polyprenyl-6-methoxyphenol hydroxylase-like FAD-dependent oxidoreductase